VDTNGFNVTFNQPTTGQGLTKQGEGVLRFNTVNTFNSGVNDIDIEAGTVRLGINEALGQPLVRLYDTTLDLNGFAPAVSTLSGSGTVQLGSGGANRYNKGIPFPRGREMRCLMVEPAVRSEVLTRLRTVKGHIAGIERMVEEQQDCAKILIQLSAIRSSVEKIGVFILENNAVDCLCSDLAERPEDRQKIEAVVKQILNYLK